MERAQGELGSSPEPGLTERHEPTPANLTSTKLSCSLVRVRGTLTGEPALESSVRGRRPWREVRVMELEGGSRLWIGRTPRHAGRHRSGPPAGGPRRQPTS